MWRDVSEMLRHNFITHQLQKETKYYSFSSVEYIIIIIIISIIIIIIIIFLL